MMSSVLLAIKDDELRRYLGLRLTRSGCAVTRVSNLDAALTLLNEVPYDVLLLSIDSNDPEEVAFAREAEQIDPDMRIMFITGFSAVAVRRAEERPVEERPIHLSRLAEAIQRLTAA